VRVDARTQAPEAKPPLVVFFCRKFGGAANWMLIPIVGVGVSAAH
jgi:hypothetical protein